MGTLEGGARVVKLLVFFFNFLFFVFGIAILGVGIWAKVKFGDYAVLSESVNYATASNVLIAAGVIVALVAFFGCCGAWKENRLFLIIFFILLLVILGLEIAAAYLGYNHRSQIKDQLETDMLKAVLTQYGDQDGVTKAVDQIQEQESCCGVNNYTDWQASKFANGSHSKVPDSCCKTISDKCGVDITGKMDTINKEGCGGKLLTLIQDKLYVIGAMAITILVIQILGMIFALVLICKIGSSETYA